MVRMEEENVLGSTWDPAKERTAVAYGKVV